VDTLAESTTGKMLFKSMAIHYYPFRTWHPSWRDSAGANSIWITLFDNSGVFTEEHVIYEGRAFTKDGASNPTLTLTDLSVRNELAES